MGKNRKNIIIAAIVATLTIGINVATANSLSNLLQMDVKKSSTSNAIDVTFYTTGELSNSVVTKKTNNKYVVLLPNTSSSPSVTPNIGGIKDLVTNIDVKHINDGIGGYTKVTFDTTQPINIKTHNKKTNPLTQAQKDTQAIIAKNNTVNKTTETPKTTAQKTKITEKEQKTKTENTTTQKTSTPKIKAISIPSTPVIAQKPKQETAKQKVENKAQPKKVVNTKQTTNTKTTSSVNKEPINTYVPKMKFDENGKRIIDLEPRVSHSIVVEKPATAPATVNTVFAVPEQTQNISQNTMEDTAIDTPVFENNTSSNHMPLWIIAIGGAIATLGILYLVFDAMSQAKEKDQTRLQSFFKLSAQNQAKRRRRDYYDIANNKDLSWQEKYKMYTEKEEQRNPKVEESAVSFVTDMSGTKKAIVMPEVNTETTKNVQSYYKDIVNEKLQAKISQMEHALAQTPKNNEPDDISNEIKSEDDAITNKITEIKLKSFSKPVTLKETQRSLVEEDKKISRNKSYKEGKFVKLKNSPLSVNRRKSSISNLETSDLIETGNKYLTNNGEMKMNKENENYLVSSLNEYISILDSEEKTSTIAKGSVADTLSQIRSSAQAMSRSGMTNPMMAKETNPISQTMSSSSTYMNGLIVKSGYNIDSEKGFYVVNIDGVSSLVGRIKDDIFVLKKFDYVVDKPIQVRQDHGNVYIVRVGKFKCLVDVAQDKMGTLIEI